MLTDSHCHLGTRQFVGEVGEIVAQARAAGVVRLVTLATCLEDGPINREIAEAHEGVYFCAGIHPCDVHETGDDFIGGIRELMGSAKAVAIGEIGLDYFHAAPKNWTEEAYHARQRDFLEEQFALAKELGRNVVIHTRDREGRASFDDAIAIYRKFASEVQAVFHCFIGTAEAAREVLDLGGLVSFTGIATFPKGREVLEVAASLAAGEFMVETDAPYLSPVPHRGKRCEPAYTRHTAEAIALARGESLEVLAAHTEVTVNQFFKLS